MTKVYVLSITETWEVDKQINFPREVDLSTEVVEDVRTRIRVFACEQRAIHAEEAAHTREGLTLVNLTGFARLVDVSTSIVQQEIIQ